MPIVVWSASAMIVLSIPVAWWALATDGPSNQRVAQHLGGQNRTLREATLLRSRLERVVLPLTRQIGSKLVRFTPIGWIDGRNRALAKAGLTGRFTAEQYLGAKILLPLLTLLLLGSQLSGDLQGRTVLLVGAAVVGSFFVPDLLVRASSDRRADAMTQALPDMLDQVTIAVEAGLGFESALARSCRNQTDPLAQEFLRMLQDVSFGASRSDALAAMVERSRVDDLKTAVIALRQADALGVPLAKTLRTVAGDVREKRRFRAEERAQRLPTLMIFPLGLCILPALFIVILGPAIIAGGGRF